MTKKDQIKEKAAEILAKEPSGLRYTELVQRLMEACPQIPENTIGAQVSHLDTNYPEAIYKQARGRFRHVTFRETQAEPQPPGPSPSEIREEHFYKPFADWLVNELEECTRAIPLGGNRFKDKWGTPDVLGVREPRKSDILKPLTEIVAVELKMDSSALITAFGQACAYSLFAHKSYIVVPQRASDEDAARLDALARIFGVGLIFFNADDPKAPAFSIRVRATRREPDMFYVNKYLKLVEAELFE